MPVSRQVLDDAHHARRQDVNAGGEDGGQFLAQEAQPFAHRNPALQQKGANLIDDAGALTDQPFTHPMQCLQIELVGRLGGNEFHCRPLHRLGNCFRVAIIVLLSF